MNGQGQGPKSGIAAESLRPHLGLLDFCTAPFSRELTQRPTHFLPGVRKEVPGFSEAGTPLAWGPSIGAPARAFCSHNFLLLVGYLLNGGALS